MADINAADILKQNIIALDKCPMHHHNLWRQAIAKVNHAGQSPDPQIGKGAETTLALLPNMLLRAPSALERWMTTRHKMDLHFARFFSGNWEDLIEAIPLSSISTYEQEGLRIPRTQVRGQNMLEESQIKRASNLAKEGLISKACRALKLSPPAPATQETLLKLQQLHPQPSVPVHSAIPRGAPRDTYIPTDKAFVSAIRNAPNKIRSGPTIRATKC